MKNQAQDTIPVCSRPTLVRPPFPEETKCTYAPRHSFGSVARITRRFLLAAIAILVVVTILSNSNNRHPDQQYSPIACLRTTSEAEGDYHRTHHHYGSLEDLAQAGLVDPALTGCSNPWRGHHGSYYRLQVVSRDRFYAVARPVVMNEGSIRSFYVDETGSVWCIAGVPAAPVTDWSGHVPGPWLRTLPAQAEGV